MIWPFVQLMWPIKAIIRIPRKNGEEIFFDRAKRVIDKKTKKEKFRLRKMSCNANASAFSQMVRTNNGLYVELYSPTKGEFHPCKLQQSIIRVVKKKGKDGKTKEVEISKAPRVVPMSSDQKWFYADEVDRAHARWQKKKGFIDKFLPIILVAVFAFALVLIMYGFSSYGGDIMSNVIGNAAKQWQAVADAAKPALEAVQQAQVGPAPPG